MHIYVRIEPRWGFTEVRRAALAFAREVERRAPSLATSKWWKEERHGVFLDYNQNAKDRTIAAAYSVRPKPDARVSAPLAWDEVEACEPADFTLATMPVRFEAVGDRHRDIDQHPGEPRRHCSSCRRGRRRKARATRPGRRTTASSPARRRASRRRNGACRSIPLIEIGRAREKADALAGFERWKTRHPDAAAHLEPADVLVDAMRGRFRTWTRIRVNLQHVPDALRPAQEALDPDEDVNDWPKGEWPRARRG